MTQQQAAKYAQECKRAKKAGLERPERPQEVTTSITHLADTEKAIIIARTTLSLIEPQMDMLLDWLAELQTRSPQAHAFLQMADNINQQILDTEMMLKRIR